MSDTQTLPTPQSATETITRQMPPWNVVLLDDDHHTFDFVIRMLQEVFGHNRQRAELMAKTVDRDGRVVCLTTHKELAELKQEQMHSFGRDAHIPECAGAMWAIIEPAEFGGGDADDVLPPDSDR